MKKTTFGLMVALAATGMLLMSFTSLFSGEATLPVPDDASPKAEVDSVVANTFTAVRNEMSLAMPELGNDLMSDLQERIRYPQKAIDRNIEGTVVIMFTVNSQGAVENVKLVKDIGGQCGEEACRAARTMRFIPAMQNGFAVKQDFYVPVVFSLNSLK